MRVVTAKSGSVKNRKAPAKVAMMVSSAPRHRFLKAAQRAQQRLLSKWVLCSSSLPHDRTGAAREHQSARKGGHDGQHRAAPQVLDGVTTNEMGASDRKKQKVKEKQNSIQKCDCRTSPRCQNLPLLCHGEQNPILRCQSRCFQGWRAAQTGWRSKAKNPLKLTLLVLVGAASRRREDHVLLVHVGHHTHERRCRRCQRGNLGFCVSLQSCTASERSAQLEVHSCVHSQLTSGWVPAVTDDSSAQAASSACSAPTI